VIGSPLAGLDPGACIDGRALVRELEAKLAASPDLKALPGKFCFLIDDGGRLGLDAIAADVRLIGVGGRIVLAIASGQMTFTPVALKEPSEAVDAAIALARAFLALCTPVSARRMEQLVLSLGAAEVARAAGMTPETPITALARRVTEVPDVIGLHDGFTGAAAPFGRLHAGQMDVLAALAPHGLRLTPWRSVLLPGAPSGTLHALKDAGLIVSPEDPRLAIAACPGAPACASAQVDTRHAAESLAPLARAWAANGITLHMSGCAKGCASAAPAPITLIGRDGAYDLLFDGRAGDEPLLRGLDLKRAQAAIEEARMRKAMA
jgi:precorrin-3B synthase